MKQLHNIYKAISVTLVLVGLTYSGVVVAHEGAEDALPDGSDGILFIAMGPSNNFAMIDLATEKVMKAVAGQLNPHGIAVTPDGKTVYLTSRTPDPNQETGTGKSFPVVAIDTQTGEIKAKIDVGGESHHAWMNPDGEQVYVTVPKNEGIVAIDTKTNTVLKKIETGFKANSSATSPDGTQIYVLNKGDDSLSVIDRATLTVQKTVTVGKGPDHLAVSPIGDFIYFTAAYGNEVWALNAKTMEPSAQVQVDKGPHGIAVSADGKQVYVANRGEGSFTVFAGGDLEKN